MTDFKDRLKVYGCLLFIMTVIISIVIFGFYFKEGVSEFRIPVIGFSIFYGLITLIIIIRFRIEIAGIIVEIPILAWESISEFLSSKFQKEEAIISSVSATHSDGVRQCKQCGRTYEISINIEDMIKGKEVRVAVCKVCHHDQVYAICEHCADIEKVTRSSCPQCGAQDHWVINEMVLRK